MDKRFCDEVIVAMLPHINNSQLILLTQILNSLRQKYSLEESSKTLDSDKDANEGQAILSQFIQAKKLEGCSPKTIKYYENTISKMLNTISKPPKHIDTSDLRQYLNDYQEANNASRVSVDNIRRILSSFFAWLEDEDYIIKSPVRRIHKVKSAQVVKEVFTDEEVETLKDNCNSLRNKAIVELLSSSGMRVGELVNLNKADINLNERECVVLGKGNKQRLVYFDARAKLALEAYLKTRNDDNEALFTHNNIPSKRLQIGGVEKMLRAMGSKLSITKVHPHKFRRTLATSAIDKGMPIEQVQHLLGHQKIDTTLHYAMVKQHNVKHAHKKFIS